LKISNLHCCAHRDFAETVRSINVIFSPFCSATLPEENESSRVSVRCAWRRRDRRYRSTQTRFLRRNEPKLLATPPFSSFLGKRQTSTLAVAKRHIPRDASRRARHAHTPCCLVPLWFRPSFGAKTALGSPFLPPATPRAKRTHFVAGLWCAVANSIFSRLRNVFVSHREKVVAFFRLRIAFL